MLCVGITALSGCYDDSALLDQMKDLQSQIDDLKTLCTQNNTNIQSLQTIVNALQQSDYVTSITPINEGDKVIGYVITFNKSGSVTIYNGKNGAVPVITVAKDGDDWYWMVDGEWLLDTDGKKVRASANDGESGSAGEKGVTPTLKIEDGYWYVSYDGGETWENDPLGQATGEKGDSIFSEVTYDEYYVYITLDDGQRLILSRAEESEPVEPCDPVDLSSSVSANSYIVSQKGSYKFKTVKGNSKESVGMIASVELLWETFGTDESPSVGDLVKDVTYDGGFITFRTADVFKEGNAVIAAKDATNNILWSWHIWLTDQPEGQEYFNGAGVMMDRNLGATSANPGDVDALGLMYQWGRKDPFLGSSSVLANLEAKSTADWPLVQPSDAVVGTMEYATSFPMTFITSNSNNHDWYYADDKSTDNTRWTTSDKNKSVYDPCPAGWRIPDGGEYGIWAKAFGSSEYFEISGDRTNNGVDCSLMLGTSNAIWYPFAGAKIGNGLADVGNNCGYWTASTDGGDVYLMVGEYYGINPSYTQPRSHGRSVRCVQEYSMSKYPGEAVDLSERGTSNSYIVSEAGVYNFNPTKGNSESRIMMDSAEVLWETLGTDAVIYPGDLITDVKYDYKSRVIKFRVLEPFQEGNAVIAAKFSDNIVWSWHIWLTDQPEDQEYFNGAGTMMDRNLGATSATPGDVGALGLLYQWGRKDPFLGSSSISDGIEARSTVAWPSPQTSDESIGTIDYATRFPMTFIKSNNLNRDWYYTGDESTDTARWTTSDKDKSIYDPCPYGWRVPDGGENGVWAKALGSSSEITDFPYDASNFGYEFSAKFGAAGLIWYPGGHSRSSSYLSGAGDTGNYWSATPLNEDGGRSYSLRLMKTGRVLLTHYNNNGIGISVRCVKE